MATFSVENMQEIRKSKGYTYETVSMLTGIPKSTITKVFGGFQTNPSALFLAKIAQALECGIDDFFIWDKEPVSPYSITRKIAAAEKEIIENPDLRLLIHASKNLSKEAIDALVKIASLIKN